LAQAPHLTKFDQQNLRKFRQKVEAEPFLLARGVFGLKDLTLDFHYPLIKQFSDLDWLRLLICAFRGCFKTSVMKVLVLWYLLTHENTSCLLVEQRMENAESHIDEMQHMMRSSSLFLEMFAERIPPGFEGWNLQTILFNRTDPLAHKSLKCAGLDSKLESKHVDLLWCNDLEGADAQKSDSPNEDSERFIMERAIPLLKDPMNSRIVVEGTPHGNGPLVHKIKRLVGPGPADWKCFWMPIRDENSQPTFPERFPIAFIQQLDRAAETSTKARVMRDQQYDLKEHVDVGGGFDMRVIRDNFYRVDAGQLIVYKKRLVNPDIFDPVTGKHESELVTATAHMGSLRYYIHGDPKHRRPEDMRWNNKRDSLAAIGVVGVNWDFHAFVVDTWIKAAGLTEFMDNYIRLYRKWNAYSSPTFEAIGAQVWIRDYLRLIEKTSMRQYITLPTAWRPGRRIMPRLSSRLQESHRESTNKELYIQESLEPWHNQGWLHLHESQHVLIQHHEAFPSLQAACDGVDMLAQGPKVWKPPMSNRQEAILRQREERMAALNPPFPYTGYAYPHATDVN
jgi:hypothetical protein